MKELNFLLDYVFRVMKDDTSEITKYEFELIMKLRKIKLEYYDIAYKSTANLLDLIEKNEQNKY
ncbi:MAG: hypothetical protein RR945_03200 [Erysipelotrichaceae bacterium]